MCSEVHYFCSIKGVCQIVGRGRITLIGNLCIESGTWDVMTEQQMSDLSDQFYIMDDFALLRKSKVTKHRGLIHSLYYWI